MATRREHPERYGWWINELESLCVGVYYIGMASHSY